MSKIDIIIPVYKPDGKFLSLIGRLEKQTVSVNKVLIVNTEEKYFERLIYGSSFMDKYQNLGVTHISRREFDHGGTRQKAVKRSDADIFVMMTQDAVPADDHLLEELIKPLENKAVAVSYARQLPAPDCGEIERFTRMFNYPKESSLKSKKDLEQLGIKTYFCSNVCAAYRRETFDQLGGFEKHTIFNEDMIYAAGAIKAGWSIAYAAQAQVIHSHNHSGKEYFHRYFDLGVSQASYPGIFQNVPSEKEGKSLALKTVTHLWREGFKQKIPAFFVLCVFKYAGYWLGEHFRKLPRWVILRCTSNRVFWDKM